MATNYVQTDTSATFNVGCSGATAATTTVARTATIGGTAGSTEMSGSWTFGQTVAAYAFELPAPGSSITSWAGSWTIPINITTCDGGDQMSAVYLCDWLPGTGYVSKGSATPGSGYTHTRGNTGVVSVSITASSGLQSASLSQPFIVVVFNNNDAHGAAGASITPNQTIIAPYSLVNTTTLTADPGATVATGTDVTLLKSKTIAADVGAAVAAGTAATLNRVTHMTASAGAATVAGTDATLKTPITTMTADPGAVVATDPSDAYLTRLEPASSGTVTMTGTDVTMRLPITRMAADAGASAATGTDATLNRVWTMAADPGAVTMAGTAATLRRTVWHMAAAAGIVLAAGTAAALNAAKHMAAGTEAVTVATPDETLLSTQQGSTTTLTADPGAVTVAGTAINRSWVMVADQGFVVAYELGLATNLTQHLNMAADPGAATASGTDVSFARSMAAGVGPATVTTPDETTFQLQSASITLTADPGAVVVSGTAISRPWIMAADPGAATASGTAATLNQILSLVADPGVAAAAGTETINNNAIHMAADPGAATAVGTDAYRGWRLGVSPSGGFVVVGEVGLLPSLDVLKHMAAGFGAAAVATPSETTLTVSAASVFTMVADPGAATVTGTDATLNYIRSLVAGVGVPVVTGTDIAANKTLAMAASSGAATVATPDETLLSFVPFGTNTMAADAGAAAVSTPDETTFRLPVVRMSAGEGAVVATDADDAYLVRSESGTSGTVTVTTPDETVLVWDNRVLTPEIETAAASGTLVNTGLRVRSNDFAVVVTGSSVTLTEVPNTLVASPGAVTVDDTEDVTELIWLPLGDIVPDPGAVVVSGTDINTTLSVYANDAAVVARGTSAAIGLVPDTMVASPGFVGVQEEESSTNLIIERSITTLGVDAGTVAVSGSDIFFALGQAGIYRNIRTAVILDDYVDVFAILDDVVHLTATMD